GRGEHVLDLERRRTRGGGPAGDPCVGGEPPARIGADARLELGLRVEEGALARVVEGEDGDRTLRAELDLGVLGEAPERIARPEDHRGGLAGGAEAVGAVERRVAEGEDAAPAAEDDQERLALAAGADDVSVREGPALAEVEGGGENRLEVRSRSERR